MGAGVEIFSASGFAAGADEYFFRVRAMNGIGNSYWSNIATTEPVELAAGKAVSASSEYSASFAATKANDGMISTIWAGLTTDPQSSWAVDLGQNFRLHAVEVVTRQDIDQPYTRNNIEIQASADGSFANPVVLAAQGETALPYQSTWSVPVSLPATFRHVRLVKTDGDEFTLAEVRVSGAIPPPAPAAPAGLVATPVSSTAVDLTWVDESADEIGFRVERKTGAEGVWEETASVPANTVGFSDTGLAAGTEYFYRVRSTNGVDLSSSPQEIGATTPADGLTYQTWAAGYPDFTTLPAPEQLPAADANRDGISNLLAFAMHLDPLAGVPADSLPGIMEDGGGHWFRFRRGSAAVVLMEVLASPDLSEDSWEILDLTDASVVPVPGEENVETVRIPLPAGKGLRFARLRVTLD